MIIKQLPAHEAQKIAAGEVVERPANIVKELIENSLDAGATRIAITLEEGGKQSITITDNGSGMIEDDARICFHRHTTSKLSTFDELESITTFGFRGEALASICSVAKVTLTTRHASNTEGLKLTLNAGTITQEAAVAYQQGTTITIEDLFFNVPARKKFLKTAVTEWNHNAALFKAFCLSNLNVHFSLTHDGALVYNCPPVSNIEERIAQLFDAQVESQVLPLVPAANKEIQLSGALTGTHYARFDRAGLFFFVNNRWVKNYKLSTALIKGYLNVLQPGRFPIAVISLQVDPKLVDINIHPKKEEVQFLHPRIIEAAITESVKNSLEKSLSHHLKKTVTLSTQPVYTPFERFESPFLSPQPQPSYTRLAKLPEPFFEPLQEPAYTQAFVQEEHEQDSYRLIGQFNKTYLLLEHPEGLFIVDQHAAHERVLYEQFCARFKNQETVQLMFPHIITLNEQDFVTLQPHLELFKDHGIALEEFGQNQLAITATPVYAKRINLEELIQEVVATIKTTDTTDREGFFKKITEHMRAQMACKAAVKAGDELSEEKITQLLKDLQKTTNRFSCPHGRPTSWLLDTLSIEKKFKRKL